MKSIKLNLPRKLAIFVVALAAVAIVPLSFAEPAEACGVNTFCMWEHINYGGSEYQFYNPEPADGCITPSSWANKASSVWNRTGRYVTLYDNGYCYYPLLTVPPGWYSWDLRSDGINDRIESFKAL